MMVGEGGAPAVKRRTGVSSLAAAGSLTSMMRTVGAAQKAVASPDLNSLQTSGGSILGMQTLVPPTAATPQVKVQPLQWNIGSVHRYLEWASSRRSRAMARAFRYAPRWWYMTPLGRPVVPEG